MSAIGTARGAAAAIALAFACTVPAADKPAGRKPDPALGTTMARPPVPFDPNAMNAMLRADRDKDGVLSREELDQYDLSLSRRFREVDADRDGKLTLYEFEKLVGPPETSAAR